MTALALATRPRSDRRGHSARTAAASPLVQRRSTLAETAPVYAPPICDAGRPLDAGVRDQMESGFGRSFDAVRVHDDARAHDNARVLDARAYAAGNDIVFGEGAYRPESTSGRALIAHELAHTVQQSGVQMKSAGPIAAGVDRELETQADSAAGAVLAGRSAPALSQIAMPVIQRLGADETPPAPPSNTTVAAPANDMPPEMVQIKDDSQPDTLIAEITNFKMPSDKGSGKWVDQGYKDAASGQGLVTTMFLVGKLPPAYSEDKKTGYAAMWLNKFGFTDVKDVARTFESQVKSTDTGKETSAVKAAAAKPQVTEFVGKLKSGFGQTANVDHVVERQLGGSSIPSNLQLLTAAKNQEAGRETYNRLVGHMKTLIEPGMRGTKYKRIQFRIKNVILAPTSEDPSFILEELLRDGNLKGNDAVKKKHEGKPVFVEAGGKGETMGVADTGETIIDTSFARIVPGLKLTKYVRKGSGAASKLDEVDAEVWDPLESTCRHASLSIL